MRELLQAHLGQAAHWTKPLTATDRRLSLSFHETTCLPTASSAPGSPGMMIMMPSMLERRAPDHPTSPPGVTSSAQDPNLLSSTRDLYRSISACAITRLTVSSGATAARVLRSWHSRCPLSWLDQRQQSRGGFKFEAQHPWVSGLGLKGGTPRQVFWRTLRAACASCEWREAGY